MYSPPQSTLATASVSVVLTNSMRTAPFGVNVAGPSSVHAEPSNVMVTVAVGDDARRRGEGHPMVIAARPSSRR